MPAPGAGPVSDEPKVLLRRCDHRVYVQPNGELACPVTQPSMDAHHLPLARGIVSRSPSPDGLPKPSRIRARTASRKQQMPTTRQRSTGVHRRRIDILLFDAPAH